MGLPQAIVTQPRMFHQPVLPDSAEEGAYCFRSSDNTLHVRNGGAWSSVAGGGGVPAGANTQIQFNNTGAFGASPNATYDIGSDTFRLGGATNFAIGSPGSPPNMLVGFYRVPTLGYASRLSWNFSGGESIDVVPYSGGTVETSGWFLVHPFSTFFNFHYHGGIGLAVWLDVSSISTPANPAAGTRRLFVDSATGKISVRTSAGATVSLEELGTVTSVATGTGLTGGPITGSGTISLADTAVTPGTYTPPLSITVDAQGRITAIT